MKQTLSLILAAVMLAATLVGCAAAPTKTNTLSANVRLTSSDAADAAAWLDERLGEFPTAVVLGTSADGYGIDLSDFESDGYIIRTVGGETLIFAPTAVGLDMAVRRYAKEAETSGRAPADETYREGARIERLTIAGHDISEYAIVLTAGEGEHAGYIQDWVKTYIASAMQKLLLKATGVTVPLDAEAQRYIIFDKVPESTDFSQSDFIYEVSDDGTLTVTYSDMVGAKYGMTMFLHNELGWQDIAVGDDLLPDADEIDVPAGTRNETHPLFDYGLNTAATYRPPKVDYQNAFIDVSVNGYRMWYRIDNAHHGMYRYANCAPDGGQICYTDETRYDNIRDVIFDEIDTKLAAGAVIGEDLNVISLGQNDAFGYCSCKSCLRVRAEENNSNAGAVVRWTNRLAAEAEDEGYYGLKYTFFAYHGSNKPCKSPCREDVYVTLCTDGHCSRHSLDGSQCQWESFDELGTLGEGYLHLNNNHYAEFVRGWSELCPNLYVWFYALDNNLHQYVILDQMYDDFKFLGECGVKGVFWQMAYTGFGVEKIEQQLGLLLDLRPEMTKEEYRAELIRLLDKTYGDGWAQIMEYLDLWEQAELAVKDCKNCWNYASVTEFDAVDAATYLSSWDRMIELLEAAIPKARSARQQAACEILTVSMYYVGCNIDYFSAYAKGDTARLEVLAARWALIIERLRSNRFNIAIITGQDGVKFHLDEDINKTAWSQWAKNGEFSRYYPDIDPDSPDLPTEWLGE